MKRTIKATANRRNRTFTLRITYADGTKTKYRTMPLSKDKFQTFEYNTENDWKQFLKSDDYYSIK